MCNYSIFHLTTHTRHTFHHTFNNNDCGKKRVNYLKYMLSTSIKRSKKSS